MTTLYDGQKMPLVGLGIGNLPHEQIVPAVKEAVSLGIRLIDTAAASKNEHILARALNEVKFGDNVKILTKVWYTHLGYERTKRAVYESINNLGRTSIDIVILHWPRCNDEIEWMHCEDEEAALPDVDKETGPPPGPDSWKESWAALEDLYTAGKVKMIGVSNFNVEEMKELELIAKVKPHLMQGNVWSLIFDPTLMHVLRQNKVHFQAYNALNGVLPSLTIGHNADPVQRRCSLLIVHSINSTVY
jgi:diketogulonate reductase-like aldo/keto reductase